MTNCKFFAGKAEDILPNLLRDVDSKEVNTVLYILNFTTLIQVVAVVDPPRAGLHPR